MTESETSTRKGLETPPRSRRAPGTGRSALAKATARSRVLALALALAVPLGAVACGPPVRPAVTLKLRGTHNAPGDATVTIDEEYVGPLRAVAVRGVRLPAGEHRITVEKVGYFPWDRLVEADREPITLEVTLEPIPQ